jgi:DNA-binding IclR family transcriptional regulator
MKRVMKADSRRGIQSIEIGMGVLDTLAALGGPSPLGAIAQGSGLSAPQAHRYLVSLVASGMAQQDTASGRYDLGPAALRLGLGALARTDAFRSAERAIDAFVARSGRTVQIAALGPLGPTVVRWHMGRPAVMTSFTVGAVLPLLHSATGHVFLSFTPEQETETLVERELERENLDPGVVRAIRARVREARRADVEGTMIPGLRATAFPIFDLQGRAVLCATSLTSGAFAVSDDAAQLGDLEATCRAISVELGWSDRVQI